MGAAIDARTGETIWIYNPKSYESGTTTMSLRWNQRGVAYWRGGNDERTRQKAEFYVKQIANAFSPSNFVLTNPELLRETFASDGENLVRGMQQAGRFVEETHQVLKPRVGVSGVDTFAVDERAVKIFLVDPDARTTVV